MRQSLPPVSRREAAKALGAAAITAAGMRSVHAQSPSSDVIRVGLIGAGGRGTGAMMQALAVPGSNVKLTAIADVFDRSIAGAVKQAESQKDKFDCPDDRRFQGLDAYRKVLDHCDLVILASPPAFRPFHFAEAVKAGKHVFMEKPVCVDAAGARMVLAAARQADEKKLKVVVGLQRHYEDKYRQTLSRVRDGLAGDLVSGVIYWNGDRPWFKNRQPGMSELQYQVYNWGHFNWLSGDHIVEQAVHSIDRLSWAMNDELPVNVVCTGGREVRPDKPEGNNIFDHFCAAFEYADGRRGFHMCRHFPGAANDNSDYVVGTKGTATVNGFANRQEIVVDGSVWQSEAPKNDMYQTEHDELFASIRSGKPINDGVRMTNSTAMAIMARMSAYTGQAVSWQHVWESKEDLSPPQWALGPLPPPAPVAVPGRTKLI